MADFLGERIGARLGAPDPGPQRGATSDAEPPSPHLGERIGARLGALDSRAKYGQADPGAPIAGSYAAGLVDPIPTSTFGTYAEKLTAAPLPDLREDPIVGSYAEGLVAPIFPVGYAGPGPGVIEAPEPQAASPAKRITGHAGKRMRGPWLNLPEEDRPEELPGGLVVFPFNRSDYEARLQQAVQDGKVSPKVAKQVLAAYDKWKRTPWGAMVDYSRLKREEKHIGMEAKADSDLIAEEKARSDAELYQKLEKASAQAQEDYEIERLAYQEELDDAVAKQQSAIDMLASRKVDPNRWWNSRSDAQKVVGALSIALGTAASAAAGVYGRPTANVAYDIIKNTISRDLRAQEVDLSSAKAAVRGRQSLLGTMRAQVGDTAQARELARMALMDQTKAKLQMYASNAQGDAARRNAHGSHRQ